jgi:4'-phosphopantetheinyl transferase EntD
VTSRAARKAPAEGPPPCAVAVRRVADGPEAFEALSLAERALLGERATAKRRAEFAAGRAAARAALVRLLGRRARGCVVLREAGPGTAPVAVGAEGSLLPAHVSITHAAGVAVAIAGPERLGVDLVAVEPVDGAFRDEAFAPDELAAWEAFTGDGAGGDRAACTAFAAKEVALKWLGTGLGLPLLGVHAVPAGPPEPARLGRLAGAGFTLEVRAPGVRRRLAARLATSAGLVLVAAWGPV